MKTSFFAWLLPLSLLFAACQKTPYQSSSEREEAVFNPENVARIFSALPLGQAQLREVHGAVNASSGDGYDEEYTMKNLLENPGSGVGPTKASLASGEVPLRDMLADYLKNNPPAGTKSGASDVQAWLDELSASQMQIYWPFCENWDGETLPVVTFAPDFDTDSNYGYEISVTPDGARVVDSVFVDEAMARQRPVWVINNNSDASYTPLQLFELDPVAKSSLKSGTDGQVKRLYLKSINALRNYDCWFAGASEFFLKVGSVAGLDPSSTEELEKYYPKLNDMMIVVKRSEVGKTKTIDNLLVSPLDDNLEKIALLLTEDDGGTRTSWKCSASVKIKSKSYGFDIDIPYNAKDDVVWRGQIDADYFRTQKTTSGRFGDVKLEFELR